MKNILSTLILVAVTYGTSYAQIKNDTLFLNFGENSIMQIVLNSEEDYQVLKSYDLDAVVASLVEELRSQDIDVVIKDGNMSDLQKSDKVYIRSEAKEEIAVKEDDDKVDFSISFGNKKTKVDRLTDGKTRFDHSTNFDVGLNNYLQDGSLANNINDLYAVRTAGSWVIAANSVLSIKRNRFILENGLGVRMNNFKFQNPSVRVEEDMDMVNFVELDSDNEHIKSRLTVMYLNAHIVPTVRMGKRGRFHLGVGPSVGYRIGSYNRIVEKVDGDKMKDRNKKQFFTNNFRYGVRCNVRILDTDFFVEYDMNNLFQDNAGPKLNTVGFGITI